jgi:hypothetical protein
MCEEVPIDWFLQTLPAIQVPEILKGNIYDRNMAATPTESSKHARYRRGRTGAKASFELSDELFVWKKTHMNGRNFS